ncbi:2,3-bisphosphoglycerate-independent phosphoglycerate mutase [Myxococcaceae bacterium]|jgi:2,3-bisphosphoglycerate-independent phosphoglycerate mutase|nr:2,3-bisphosphoglycerate-independent phosphoglycerate mutase [Myxococcaceae bacterium]
MNRPVMLIVLDGFGLGDRGPGDATARARAPFFAAADRHPHAKLETSGEAVGLPPGQMGNSEVGHMTMGAGRVIDQDITRISKAIAAGELETNPAVQGALDAVRRRGTRLHLLALVSDGGVHSHVDHLVALLDLAKRHGIAAQIHAFLDGRDTPPSSGLGYIEALVPVLERTGARISTVSGRYYAMDRDNRWERVKQAYDAIVLGRGVAAPDPVAAVREAYARKETDEFVKPTVVDGGAPLSDGDAVIFVNFRADRARELTNAITGQIPERFEAELEREKIVSLSTFVCLTEYDERFDLPVAFANEAPKKIVGELLASAKLRQLRVAETEKYAHVTFFFNGGREQPFPGEDRILVPSPRGVATYDLEPEMSAIEVTDELLAKLDETLYDFVLVNYANPDMVGHTGVLAAAIEAVETIDVCLARVTEAVLARGGCVLVTADHGNCEQMIDPETGGPHTAHTTNPVPIWWITNDARGRTLRDGTLADLAPTILELLGLPRPVEMTGRSLLVPPK